MFDSRPRAPSLGGASKKELTREQLLEDASKERIERAAARKRAKSALWIQRLWRAHWVRINIQRQFIDKWIALYGKIAADPQGLLLAETLQGYAIPLLLHAFLPCGAQSTRELLRSGGPCSDAQLAVAAKGLEALKGGLLLILRSLVAEDPASSYLYLGATMDSKVAHVWCYQAYRIVQLCALVLRPREWGQHDGMDNLAVMVMIRLLQPPTMKGAWLKGALVKGQEGDGLRTLFELINYRVSCTPLPLFLAAVRLFEGAGGDRAPDDDPHVSSSAAAKPLRPFPSMKHLSSLLFGCAVSVVEVGCREDSGTITELPNSCASPDRQGALRCSRLLCGHFVSTVLGDPAVVPPHDSMAMLMDKKLMLPLIRAMCELCDRKALSGCQAACCLAYLCQRYSSSEDCHSSGHAQRVMSVTHTPLPRSSLLCDEEAAIAYALGSEALLRRIGDVTGNNAQSAKGRFVHGTGPKEWHKDDVQRLLSLWPLCHQTHMVQLLDALSDTDGGIVLFSELSLYLLQVFPDVHVISSLELLHGVAIPLNTLAFAPNIIPRLWLWLAPRLGVAAEMGASEPAVTPGRCSRGVKGMEKGVVIVLFLFCRLLHHLLLVLDDADFYDRQHPLSLSQFRAIVAALSALVFHSYFPLMQPSPPDTPRRRGSGPTPSRLPGFFGQRLSGYVAARGCLVKSSMAPEVLRLHDACLRKAPALLRSLRERDTRRGFCQSEVWGLPYTKWTAEAGQRRWQQHMTNAGEGGSSGTLMIRDILPHLPFLERVQYFRSHLADDRTITLQPAIQVTLHRSRLIEDGYMRLYPLGDRLKARIMITFVNEQGLTESGLDHGGLLKEAIAQICSEGFHAGYGLIQNTPDGLMYPSASADRMENGIRLLEFLGLMVGKALYEGILLDVAFAPFFVKQLQGRRPGLDDVVSLDPEIHRSLVQVKAYEGDIADLGLTFTVEEEVFGEKIEHELLHGQGQLAVTNDTRLLYCQLVADWHLRGKLGKAAEAFARGMWQIIPPATLSLFTDTEFNELLGGGQDEAGSVEDMRENTKYSGGYTHLSPTIKMFWRVVREMSGEQRRALLRFITACSRAPLGGFRHLHPQLTIHMVDCTASPLALFGGQDVDRLPSASTCYNMLKLPNYRRTVTLRKKLLYAINAGAGFELS